MSWAGSEPSQVYLGRTQVGVWSPAWTGVGAQWLSTGSAQEGWAQGIELLRHEGQPRRQRVAVWLSGALARPFVFEPVRGLRRWSEALQVAAGLAPEATGLEGPCEVWLDDWMPGKSCIAIAIDRGLRETIESTARSERLRLTAIRPWWAAALNEAMKSQTPARGLLAIEELDALTVLSGGEGVFTSAACYSPRPDPTQTEALLTRALMAANVAASDGLRAKLDDGATSGHGDAKASQGGFTSFGVRLEPIA